MNQNKKNEEMNNSINDNASFVIDAKTVHSINPLGMRVLVKILDHQDKSRGGLYIPDNAKENLSESVIAQVVAVAMANEEDDEEPTNISGIPQDALVLIEKAIGIKVPWDDRLRIIETADVLAIIESSNLT